ncbi:RNA polymerase sigma factor [uncultured Arthrobacter sp.]|uniref:RNA polymerase sigma factor n=1 Tax=uncultured Arthrobacter sp. TaxID=114050 RepID=UPI00261FB6C6|nr:RNA polymerase sigma factor [uncultured Arthrobacter sp.]
MIRTGSPSRASPASLTSVPLADLDESTVVARAQDGDPKAFERLITVHQGGVYRLCFRMLDDRGHAEDIVQETFIAAWRGLPHLATTQAFVPWLYRTATNKCLDQLRQRKRRPVDPTAELDGPSTGAWDAPSSAEDPRTSPLLSSRGAVSLSNGVSPDPAEQVETREQMRALARLLQTVPPGPRACWLLREVHGFSYHEIAAIVQLPESTVRGRIARAKRVLAEGMSPWR